jgi:hypothetical protein
MAVKVTVTKESAAVFLDVTEGDHLVYRVTPKGAKPVFTLVDSQTKKLLMSHKDKPIATQPNVVFERTWPLPADQTLLVSSHTMGFHFIAAISYRYEVEVNRSDGTTDTIMDITYSSTSPEDSFFQDLDVTAV